MNDAPVTTEILHMLKCGALTPSHDAPHLVAMSDDEGNEIAWVDPATRRITTVSDTGDLLPAGTLTQAEYAALNVTLPRVLVAIDPTERFASTYRDSLVQVVLNAPDDDDPATITAWQPSGYTSFGLIRGTQIELWSQRIDQYDDGAYTLRDVVRALDDPMVQETLARVVAGWHATWSGQHAHGVLSGDASDALGDVRLMLESESLTPARPHPSWFASVRRSAYGGWCAGSDDDGPWCDLDGDAVTWMWWDGDGTQTETLTGDDAEHVRALIADAQDDGDDGDDE